MTESSPERTARRPVLTRRSASSRFLLVSSVLSAVMLPLPLFMLGWFWPGVPGGATCDPSHQPWCTPGFGLPHWYAVAASCALSGILHLGAVVGRRRPGGRALSWSGLLAAVAALALVTVLPVVLADVVPPGWFAY